ALLSVEHDVGATPGDPSLGLVVIRRCISADRFRRPEHDRRAFLSAPDVPTELLRLPERHPERRCEAAFLPRQPEEEDVGPVVRTPGDGISVRSRMPSIDRPRSHPWQYACCQGCDDAIRHLSVDVTLGRHDPSYAALAASSVSVLFVMVHSTPASRA